MIQMNEIKECGCLVMWLSMGIDFPSAGVAVVWCSMFGETFWGCRGRDLLELDCLPTFGGDDMAPLFESSRANELLLIDSACLLLLPSRGQVYKRIVSWHAC